MREAPGPGGMLDATVAQSGTVTLDLVNLEGSEVATAADAATDTGIDTNSYATYNEYGTPTNTVAGTATYGWLGGDERSADSLGGLILMGARLYDNTTGRFLSVDRVYGGNANPYIYPTDPIDQADISGQMSRAAHRWWVGVAGFLGWAQILMDGVAFLTAIFLPVLEGVVGAIALGVTALAVVSNCIANRWGSPSCLKGVMFGLIALVVPIVGLWARLAKLGHAAHSILARFDRLSDEFNFFADIYLKIRELGRR